MFGDTKAIYRIQQQCILVTMHMYGKQYAPGAALGLGRAGQPSPTFWIPLYICCTLIYSFKFRVGYFGRDIIQKCTKWSQMGIHGLIFRQIFAKCKGASSSIRKHSYKFVQQNTSMFVFLTNNL